MTNSDRVVAAMKAGASHEEIMAMVAEIDATRANKLVGKWCDCEAKGIEVDYEGEIVYPQDGECECGMYKHHVHLVECGHVIQVG